MDYSPVAEASPRPYEIRQHNAITTARYDYSACQMDIMFFLLTSLGREDPPDKVYTLYLKEMEKISGRQWNYSQLQEATESMGSRMFNVREHGQVIQLWMMDRVVYVLGEGRIVIELTKSIRPYLFDLKENFTSYELQSALKLTSKYAKRIYHLVSQWKDKDATQVYTLVELRYMLNLSAEEPTKGKTRRKAKTKEADDRNLDDRESSGENPDSKSKEKGKNLFTKISQLKERVLDVAVAQINEHTELNISYELLKKGRSFDRARFNITHKKSASPARSFQQPAETDKLTTAAKYLDDLGIMLPVLRGRILQDPDLVTKLFKFIFDLKTDKLKATKNPGGLFLTIANVGPGARKPS
ncbi:replication initiation protein [Hymenobacter sp. BT559]|jgi:plasmid replication initiation protein|uniref:replication initiation protein n=1 Tax=Hymenobacter sp. BT559 TaxID=2795729 RepID=UPI00122147F5|nr:replication initiation protein [Hymenobacter sp. BT559]MBJ6146077.1 replication initiation protein [Hymenobacter sp. BT559]RZJ58327.1 MAG: RepB family plasmid replication initiator protein [Hymenobacter sp.]